MPGRRVMISARTGNAIAKRRPEAVIGGTVTTVDLIAIQVVPQMATTVR